MKRMLLGEAGRLNAPTFCELWHHNLPWRPLSKVPKSHRADSFKGFHNVGMALAVSWGFWHVKTRWKTWATLMRCPSHVNSSTDTTAGTPSLRLALVALVHLAVAVSLPLHARILGLRWEATNLWDLITTRVSNFPKMKIARIIQIVVRLKMMERKLGRANRKYLRML